MDLYSIESEEKKQRRIANYLRAKHLYSAKGRQGAARYEKNKVLKKKINTIAKLNEELKICQQIYLNCFDQIGSAHRLAQLIEKVEQIAISNRNSNNLQVATKVDRSIAKSSVEQRNSDLEHSIKNGSKNEAFMEETKNRELYIDKRQNDSFYVESFFKSSPKLLPELGEKKKVSRSSSKQILESKSCGETSSRIDLEKSSKDKVSGDQGDERSDKEKNLNSIEQSSRIERKSMSGCSASDQVMIACQQMSEMTSEFVDLSYLEGRDDEFEFIYKINDRKHETRNDLKDRSFEIENGMYSSSGVEMNEMKFNAIQLDDHRIGYKLSSQSGESNRDDERSNEKVIKMHQNQQLQQIDKHQNNENESVKMQTDDCSSLQKSTRRQVMNSSSRNFTIDNVVKQKLAKQFSISRSNYDNRNVEFDQDNSNGVNDQIRQVNGSVKIDRLVNDDKQSKKIAAKQTNLEVRSQRKTNDQDDMRIDLEQVDDVDRNNRNDQIKYKQVSDEQTNGQLKLNLKDNVDYIETNSNEHSQLNLRQIKDEQVNDVSRIQKSIRELKDLKFNKHNDRKSNKERDQNKNFEQTFESFEKDQQTDCQTKSISSSNKLNTHHKHLSNHLITTEYSIESTEQKINSKLNTFHLENKLMTDRTVLNSDNQSSVDELIRSDQDFDLNDYLKNEDYHKLGKAVIKSKRINEKIDEDSEASTCLKFVSNQRYERKSDKICKNCNKYEKFDQTDYRTNEEVYRSFNKVTGEKNGQNLDCKGCSQKIYLSKNEQYQMQGKHLNCNQSSFMKNKTILTDYLDLSTRTPSLNSLTNLFDSTDDLPDFRQLSPTLSSSSLPSINSLISSDLNLSYQNSQNLLSYDHLKCKSETISKSSICKSSQRKLEKRSNDDSTKRSKNGSGDNLKKMLDIQIIGEDSRSGNKLEKKDSKIKCRKCLRSIERRKMNKMQRQVKDGIQSKFDFRTFWKDVLKSESDDRSTDLNHLKKHLTKFKKQLVIHQ